MADDMVERVRVAICRSTRGPEHNCWHAKPAFGCACDKQARAALSAMREPTEAMKQAALEAIFNGKRGNDVRDQTIYETSQFGAGYRAMITAALAPPKEEQGAGG